MDSSGMNASDIEAGDHVSLLTDDWTLVGRDIVVIDVEPVPGSTQCLVRADGEQRTVSRGDLRRV